MANLVLNFEADSSSAETINLSWDRPLDNGYNELVDIDILTVGGSSITISGTINVEFGYYVIQGNNMLKVVARGQNVSTIQLLSTGSLAAGPAYLFVTTDIIIQRRKDSYPVELATGRVFTQNVAVEVFNGSELYGSGVASQDNNGNNIFSDGNADFTQDLVGRIFRDSASHNFTIDAVLSTTQIRLQSNDTLHSGLYAILADFPQTNTPQIQPVSFAQLTSSVGVINDPNGFLMDTSTNTYAAPHQLANMFVLDANNNSFLILDNSATQLFVFSTTSTPIVGFFPGYTILQTFNGVNTQFFYEDTFIDSMEAGDRAGTGLEPNTWYYYTAFTKVVSISPAGENFATFDNANSTQASALSTGESDFGNLLYNNFLPLLYRQTDSTLDADGNPAASGTGNLEDLMSIFGIQFDELYSLVKTFVLQDPTKISASVLAQFAYQMDLAPTDSIIGIDVLRRIGMNMIDIYRNKGDKIGIYKFIRTITTWDITGGTGDINSAIIDNVPNTNALRLYSAALGSLNTRLYGSMQIVGTFTPTSYNPTSGVLAIPVSVDISGVQVGDYLDINSTLYAILGGIQANPVPNGTVLFNNPGATAFTYSPVSGVVQYASFVNLSSVAPGDIFFDGAGNQFVITLVNAPGYFLKIATGQSVNTTPGVGAGGSIQQGQKQFSLNSGLSIAIQPSTVVRATPIINIVPVFTPSAYDAPTGFVSVPDSVDLTNVRNNDVFIDASNEQFPIVGGIVNTPGSKGFLIAPNQVVSLSGGAVVDRISQNGSGIFLRQLPGVIIPGFFTFREYVVNVPGIAMFEVTIAGITPNSQNESTITFSGSQNFGRVNGLVDCIYYPNESNPSEFFTIISNTSSTITLNGVPKFATVGNTGIILTPLNSNRFQRISNLIYLVSPYNTKAGFNFIYPINQPI